MKRTNKIILTATIVALLVLGIGYAAIQNITLNINGTAAADPSQANFKVMFSGTPTVSDDTYVTAAITDDTNATINVEGLTKKGDVVTATYTVQNASTDLLADLGVSTTNSNTEYFTLSSEIAQTSLVAGEATTLTVTVELTKTPITESVSATIGVQLEAMPVQPGEEGTSEGIIDFSQTPDNRNEFGFYFDKAYSATVDGTKQTVVLHKDTSCELYLDGRLAQAVPVGMISYDYLSIDASAVDFGIVTLSSDGKQIDAEGLIFELDETFFGTNPVPDGALYGRVTANYDSIKWYDDMMPPSVMLMDFYLYGDYIYTFEENGWNIELATEDLYFTELMPEDYKFTDKNQTSYGPILANINGEPISDISYVFQDCTLLETVPEIPYGVTNMNSTFEGCTALTTTSKIPNSVTNMHETFRGCTSLTTVPEIPNSVTDMSYTFYGCTGLTTASEIPNSVTNMNSTFNGCTGLTTAPEIRDSVTDMGNTFHGCTRLTTAPEIPNSVTNMSNTFNGCTGLTTAPEIPNSVTDMSLTFYGCKSLTTPPEIPSSVINMKTTFSGCTGLTTAPEIPSSVTDMAYTFYGCTKLTGIITINVSNLTYYTNCFHNVDMSKITLKGEASKETLNLLGSTGNNYTPIP